MKPCASLTTPLFFLLLLLYRSVYGIVINSHACSSLPLLYD
jgi:hypothetical protein